MSPQSGRRTPSRPAARSGPGRAGSTARRPRTSASAPRPQRPSRAPQPPAPVTPTRFTGRAAILVLVLALLAVSSASSLRAYLQQRSHIQDVQATIAEREGQIAAYQKEKDRWLDPEFMQQQARERLGFVNPGETVYTVLDDGRPLEPESTLTDPSTIAQTVPEAWWTDAWGTVLDAGDPKKRTDAPPATRITDPVGAPDTSGE